MLTIITNDLVLSSQEPLKTRPLVWSRADLAARNGRPYLARAPSANRVALQTTIETSLSHFAVMHGAKTLSKYPLGSHFIRLRPGEGRGGFADACWGNGARAIEMLRCTNPRTRPDRVEQGYLRPPYASTTGGRRGYARLSRGLAWSPGYRISLGWKNAHRSRHGAAVLISGGAATPRADRADVHTNR